VVELQEDFGIPVITGTPIITDFAKDNPLKSYGYS
jgi:hypothetical protein